MSGHPESNWEAEVNYENSKLTCEANFKFNVPEDWDSTTAGKYLRDNCTVEWYGLAGPTANYRLLIKSADINVLKDSFTKRVRLFKDEIGKAFVWFLPVYPGFVKVAVEVNPSTTSKEYSSKETANKVVKNAPVETLLVTPIKRIASQGKSAVVLSNYLNHHKIPVEQIPEGKDFYLFIINNKYSISGKVDAKKVTARKTATDFEDIPDC